MQVRSISLFARAAVEGVVEEAILAGCLTALMDSLFLEAGAALIIAVSIPLAIITYHHAVRVGRDDQHHDAGGLALASVSWSTTPRLRSRTSASISSRQTVEQAILDGAQQIAVPTFVSTSVDLYRVVPMFLLTGVHVICSVPLAEAVVFAMLRPISSRAP
jgi:multidrug efflux pump subunit AcrB